MMLFPRLVPPLVSFDSITLGEMNECLEKWGHKMGAINRPAGALWAHGLKHNDEIVAVVATADLIAPTCAGLSRAEAIELARLCAADPSYCRPALRLWREFVFPHARRPWAVSYQDEALHTGNTYRFDGWVPLARSRSGVDRNSGRPGRKKTIWGWHRDASARRAAAKSAPTAAGESL